MLYTTSSLIDKTKLKFFDMSTWIRRQHSYIQQGSCPVYFVEAKRISPKAEAGRCPPHHHTDCLQMSTSHPNKPIASPRWYGSSKGQMRSSHAGPHSKGTDEWIPPPPQDCHGDTTTLTSQVPAPLCHTRPRAAPHNTIWYLQGCLGQGKIEGPVEVSRIIKALPLRWRPHRLASNCPESNGQPSSAWGQV